MLTLPEGWGFRVDSSVNLILPYLFQGTWCWDVCCQASRQFLLQLRRRWSLIKVFRGSASRPESMRKLSLSMLQEHSDILSGSFLKLGLPFWRGPYSKDHSILASIWGSPYLRKVPHTYSSLIFHYAYVYCPTLSLLPYHPYITSFHFMFHVLFHVILHYWGIIPQIRETTKSCSEGLGLRPRLLKKFSASATGIIESFIF